MEMSVKIIPLYILLLLFMGCKNQGKEYEPIVKALNYLETQDPHFHKRFKDTIFLYVGNEDLYENESEGVYSMLDSSYDKGEYKIVFNQLKTKTLARNLIVKIFESYISKEKILYINKASDISRLGFLSIQNKAFIPEKWLFSINGFRSDKKFAVFQIAYQCDTKGYLGCEFIYDYLKQDFIEKSCYLPFKGDNK